MTVDARLGIGSTASAVKTRSRLRQAMAARATGCAVVDTAQADAFESPPQPYRLRQLESAGVVRREEAPPPVATTLYELAERGEALRPVLRELGRWGAPLLAHSDKSDEIRSYWIGLPAELFLKDGAPSQPPVTLEVRAGDEPVTLSIGSGGVRSRLGPAQKPDGIISGPAAEVVQVLFARQPLEQARKRGVRYKGDRSVLARLTREV